MPAGLAGDDLPVGSRVARLTGIAVLFQAVGGVGWPWTRCAGAPAPCSTRGWPPGSRAVPTLLLIGSESRDPSAAAAGTVAAALPDARVVVLEGQQHLADVLAPELVAGHLLGFLREPR